MKKKEVDSKLGKPKRLVDGNEIISYYDIEDFNSFFLIITYSKDSLVIKKEMEN